MNHTTEYPIEPLDSCDQTHSSFFVSITRLGLIKVDGPDAKKFLQGQLTCHLEELTSDSFRLGAHCNVQGRALATFYIFYWQEAYFIVLDHSIVSDWLNTLKKYSIFFKAGLSDVSDSFIFFGWQGLEHPIVSPYQLQVEGGDCILLGLRSGASSTPATDSSALATDSRVLAIVPKSSAQVPIYQQALDLYASKEPSFQGESYSQEHWKLSDIVSGMAHVNADTAGQYIPIELNYDLLEGIHFKKGCYTGQEIIARMHFRGKPKFRVVYAQLFDILDVSANQSLYIHEEANKILFGKVFSWVQKKHKIHAILLVNMAWLKKQGIEKKQRIDLAEPLGVVHIFSNIHDME